MSQDRFNLRSLYLYAVCLVTLLISIFSLTQMVRHGAELVYPDPYSVSSPVQVAGPGKEVPSEVEQKRAAESSRRWSILGLVSSASTLLVAAPVYVYHWRRVQRDRDSASRSGAETASNTPNPESIA